MEGVYCNSEWETFCSEGQLGFKIAFMGQTRTCVLASSVKPLLHTMFSLCSQHTVYSINDYFGRRNNILYDRQKESCREKSK